MHLHYRNFMETTCIDILILWFLLVQVRVTAMLRFLVVWVTYRYSQKVIIITLIIKRWKEKWRQGRDMVWVLVGVTGCVPRLMGLSLVTLCSLFRVDYGPSVAVDGSQVTDLLSWAHTCLWEREGSLRSCREFLLFPDRLIGGRERWRSMRHTKIGSQVISLILLVM